MFNNVRNVINVYSTLENHLHAWLRDSELVLFPVIMHKMDDTLNFKLV